MKDSFDPLDKYRYKPEELFPLTKKNPLFLGDSESDRYKLPKFEPLKLEEPKFILPKFEYEPPKFEPLPIVTENSSHRLAEKATENFIKRERLSYQHFAAQRILSQLQSGTNSGILPCPSSCDKYSFPSRYRSQMAAHVNSVNEHKQRIYESQTRLFNIERDLKDSW